MREPTTTIDPRYGVPDAVATDWETTRQTLETAQVFWLSTVRADGVRMHARRRRVARWGPALLTGQSDKRPSTFAAPPTWR